MKHNFFIRGRTYALLYFLLYISLSFSQKKDSVDYFPLNVGDIYEYDSCSYYAPYLETLPPVFGKKYGTHETKESLNINGKKYFVKTSIFITKYDTLWKDDLGNIYVYDRGKDNLFLKMNAKVGEGWYSLIQSAFSFLFRWNCRMMSRTDTVITPLDTFYNCLRIQEGMEDYVFYFAPGIGLIFRCGMLPSFGLSKAVINNNKYPNRIKSPTNEQITDFILYQNYPNPFNSSTIIEYMIPQKGHIKLIIYDILGREIKVLVDAFNYAGIYKKNWDGKDKSGNTVNSSIYFFKLIVNGYSIIKKLLFIK